ncbi:hypothetical protein JL720_14710 [Aureococcus anophagefferens]|nr:hypothetical protein JL720_14710 [Aureococcus anophagefferens]
MSFSSRRRNYMLVSHRRDQFIEFIKGLLQPSFVLDALAESASNSWAHVEELVEEYRHETPGEPSRLRTAVPSLGIFHTGAAAEAAGGARRYVQADEAVLARQDASGVRSSVPFCAFNGGSDVWVDVGTKREGVQGFQRLLGIRPENCLHVGDQFLITGNDYASRSSCPCLWITNPTETKRVLADILAVVDGSGVDGRRTPPVPPRRATPPGAAVRGRWSRYAARPPAGP